MLQFTPGGVAYRGGGFDDSHREFFTVGNVFRQPCFFATSCQEATAMRCARTQEAYGRQGILWVVYVDPAGKQDVARRCKHVNFVAHSLIVDAAGTRPSKSTSSPPTQFSPCVP